MLRVHLFSGSFGGMKKKSIRALRLAKGWTQQDLAEAARVSLRTVAKADVGGEVSLEIAEALAGALGVSRDVVPVRRRRRR